MSHPLDGIAEAVFAKALADGRAGEVLQRLFNGDSVTIDARGELVFVDQDMLGQMLDEEEGVTRAPWRKRPGPFDEDSLG